MSKKTPLIDWSEPSTKRGAVWIVSSLMAMALSFAGDRELAMQVFLGGASVAGLIGVLHKENSGA